MTKPAYLLSPKHYLCKVKQKRIIKKEFEMPAAKRKKTAAPRRRSTKSKNKSWLQSLLYILLVLLVLTAIALAAGYVYVRKNKNDLRPKTTDTEQTQSQPIDTTLNGTWINAGNGNMLTVKNENFTLDFPSVESKKSKHGKFFVNDKHIVIETSETDDCSTGKGTYTFVLDNENLTISALNDACSLRKNLFAQSWYKM